MSQPLVRIVWWDHCDPPGPTWFTPDEYAAIEGPAEIESVGWIVREEETWLAIVPHLCAEDGMGGQPTVIIKSCITSRVDWPNVSSWDPLSRTGHPD